LAFSLGRAFPPRTPLRESPLKPTGFASGVEKLFGNLSLGCAKQKMNFLLGGIKKYLVKY
jgi:hypothetical protein